MLKALKISSRQYEDQEPVENASINTVQLMISLFIVSS